MEREEMIARLDNFFDCAFRVCRRYLDAKEMEDDKALERLAEDPMACFYLYYKGVPLIGKGIKRVREKRGYTLKDMERKTGIKADVLESYEEGLIYYVPLKDAEMIRKKLQCSKEYLIEMNDKD